MSYVNSVFPLGTQIFSLSHACVMVIISSLSLSRRAKKFTIIYFIIIYHDDFEIAVPSSMQDACHT